MNHDLEIAKAMIAKAKASTALTGRVSNRVYFSSADPDATMPYVVLQPVAPDGPQRVFVGGDWEDVLYQWSAFDDGSSVETIGLIASDLDLAFDRQVLTYSDATHIACSREGGGFGPEWDGEAWQRTLTYRVMMKP